MGNLDKNLNFYNSKKQHQETKTQNICKETQNIVGNILQLEFDFSETEKYIKNSPKNPNTNKQTTTNQNNEKTEISLKKQIKVNIGKNNFLLVFDKIKDIGDELFLTIKIRGENMKNFSIFNVSIGEVKLEKIKYSSGDEFFKLKNFDIKRIIKSDNYNGGNAFRAGYGDNIEENKIFSFNYFKKFFQSNLANEIIKKEIKEYIRDYLLKKEIF